MMTEPPSCFAGVRWHVSFVWAGSTAPGIYLPDDESRQWIRVAAEMRIDLDVGDTAAYGELLTFLLPSECGVLLSATGALWSG
jgi:hypothetical protein